MMIAASVNCILETGCGETKEPGFWLNRRLIFKKVGW